MAESQHGRLVMNDLLSNINWGNVPQWLSLVAIVWVALFITRRIGNYANSLKELELNQKLSDKWTEKWLNKGVPTLRFLHWLKRHLQSGHYTDENLAQYQTVLEETLWQILPWEINQEPTLRFVERFLKILSDQPDMEKRSLIVETFIPMIEGSQQGVLDELGTRAHEDANIENQKSK